VSRLTAPTDDFVRLSVLTDRHSYRNAELRKEFSQLTALKVVFTQFPGASRSPSYLARIPYPGRSSLKHATQPWAASGGFRVARASESRARGCAVGCFRWCGRGSDSGLVVVSLYYRWNRKCQQRETCDQNGADWRCTNGTHRSSYHSANPTHELCREPLFLRATIALSEKSGALRSWNECISDALRFLSHLPFGHRAR